VRLRGFVECRLEKNCPSLKNEKTKQKEEKQKS
jgi:hypothetical protein